MTPTQATVLQEMNSTGGRFDGYCEIMLQTGLTSYKAVDWVLDALERRGCIERDDCYGYRVTDTGRLALNGKATPPTGESRHD